MSRRLSFEEKTVENDENGNGTEESYTRENGDLEEA